MKWAGPKKVRTKEGVVSSGMLAVMKMPLPAMCCVFLLMNALVTPLVTGYFLHVRLSRTPLVSTYCLHARLSRQSFQRCNSMNENAVASSDYIDNGKTIEYIPPFVVATNSSMYSMSQGNNSVNSVVSSPNINASSKRGFMLDKDRVKMKTRRDGSMFNDKLSSKIYSDYDFDDDFDDVDELDDVDDDDDDELITVDYDKPNLLPNISLYNWKFGAGIRDDFRRRLPHYKSDWTDGFHRKSISAVLYLYFACLAPTVAFGGLTNILTGGKIGVTDFIMSCGISGMLYALFAGQPMTFLGPTGLTLAFITSLYKFTESASLPFIGIYGWTGLWTALFLALSAFTNTSYLILLCTRFTDDVFNALLAVNFLFEASKNLLLNFSKVNANMVTAFASFNLAMATWLESSFDHGIIDFSFVYRFFIFIGWPLEMWLNSVEANYLAKKYAN